MNLETIEVFRRIRRPMVDDLTAAHIQGGDSRHILIGEGKVPDVQVLLHPLHMGRFRMIATPR